MRRVGAPGAPAGEARVAGVDADHFAVLRADVDAAAFNRGLRADRGADLPRGLDLAFVRVHLNNIAFKRGQNDRTAGGGRGGREVAAVLFQVTFEFHAPARLAVLGIGADDL